MMGGSCFHMVIHGIEEVSSKKYCSGQNRSSPELTYRKAVIIYYTGASCIVN